jgi:hypothetical protein
MIDKCLHCTRKHLRKAMVLWLEARLGHPEKWDVALGNLAEAADAVVLINEDFAFYLREVYLKYDNDKTFIIDWTIIFDNLDAINNQITTADNKK